MYGECFKHISLPTGSDISVCAIEKKLPVLGWKPRLKRFGWDTRSALKIIGGGIGKILLSTRGVSLLP